MVGPEPRRVGNLAILYWAAPNAKGRGFAFGSLGSVLALLIWMVASAGFAFYVANFGSYNKTYGALAGVIVFLVWLWITNLANPAESGVRCGDGPRARHPQRSPSVRGPPTSNLATRAPGPTRTAGPWALQARPTIYGPTDRRRESADPRTVSLARGSCGCRSRRSGRRRSIAAERSSCGAGVASAACGPGTGQRLLVRRSQGSGRRTARSSALCCPRQPTSVNWPAAAASAAWRKALAVPSGSGEVPVVPVLRNPAGAARCPTRGYWCRGASAFALSS